MKIPEFNICNIAQVSVINKYLYWMKVIGKFPKHSKVIFYEGQVNDTFSQFSFLDHWQMNKGSSLNFTFNINQIYGN